MAKKAIGIFCVALLLAAGAMAQVTMISIAAGSPEDKALQEIAKESDSGKKLAAYEQFIKDYAANKTAVAYAYSQMAQVAKDDGNLDQALEYGDKAVTMLPGSMELLVAQLSNAQAKSDTELVLKYAGLAAKAYEGIDTAAKPEGMSDADFEARKASDKANAKASYEYAESAAFNAAANEPELHKRAANLEAFTEAFAKGKYAGQAAELALATYQQLNEPAKVAALGEKLLQRNPESVPTLILLADRYAEDPGTVAKSLDYAHRALKLTAKGQAGENALLQASAKSIIGYDYLKQEKYAAALPELQAAAPALEGDANAYSAVLFRLGFAYVKLKRYAEAKKTLNQAVAQGGPYKELAADLLTKIPGGKRR